MINDKSLDVARTMGGEFIGIRTMTNALAVDQSTVDTGTAVNITLDKNTSNVQVTVADFPAFVKFSDDGTYATSGDFDLYLQIGQYNLARAEGQTTISYLADGGESFITTVEKGEL